jgi:hypothetical protein
LDWTFFGLTGANKVDVFLEEIEFLMANYSGEYWSWYHLAVPIRKYFVKKRIEYLEKQNKQNNPQPLSPSEKHKIHQQSQAVRNQIPPQPSSKPAMKK